MVVDKAHDRDLDNERDHDPDGPVQVDLIVVIVDALLGAEGPQALAQPMQHVHGAHVEIGRVKGRLIKLGLIVGELVVVLIIVDIVLVILSLRGRSLLRLRMSRLRVRWLL